MSIQRMAQKIAREHEASARPLCIKILVGARELLVIETYDYICNAIVAAAARLMRVDTHELVSWSRSDWEDAGRDVEMGMRMAWCCRTLLRYVEDALDGNGTYENWLVEAQGYDAYRLERDAQGMRQSRIAWIDSMIRQLGA